jgi:hypothetical protein
MKATAGDTIRIDSDRAGTPAHTGQILEVLEASFGTRYRVRWEDGHESTIHPMAGTVHLRHAESDWELPEPAR